MGTLFKDPTAPINKVMVVDDSPVVRECVSEMLAAWGFDVIQAEDGLDALEKYQAHLGAISFVIMDIEMPRLNGIEATKKIHDIDPSVKVVISSGSNNPLPPEIKPCAFLPKPYRADALREIVRQVLNG